MTDLQAVKNPAEKSLPPELRMHENAKKQVDMLRASTVILIAKRSKDNREIFARLIKGLGSGTYDRNLHSREKLERDHFSIGEIQLLNQIDTAKTEDDKWRFFTLLIRRLIEANCHPLARGLVECLMSRARQVELEINKSNQKALLERGGIPRTEKRPQSIPDFRDRVRTPIPQTVRDEVERRLRGITPIAEARTQNAETLKEQTEKPKAPPSKPKRTLPGMSSFSQHIASILGSVGIKTPSQTDNDALNPNSNDDKNPDSKR